MKIKQILEGPPNKTTTKVLLRGDDDLSSSYLEIENIKDIKELYFEINEFMLQGKEELTTPIICSYDLEKGYIIIVEKGCAIKWLNKIYNEGDTLGFIKDKEMI